MEKESTFLGAGSSAGDDYDLHRRNCFPTCFVLLFLVLGLVLHVCSAEERERLNQILKQLVNPYSQGAFFSRVLPAFFSSSAEVFPGGLMEDYRNRRLLALVWRGRGNL